MRSRTLEEIINDAKQVIVELSLPGGSRPTLKELVEDEAFLKKLAADIAATENEHPMEDDVMQSKEAVKTRLKQILSIKEARDRTNSILEIIEPEGETVARNPAKFYIPLDTLPDLINENRAAIAAYEKAAKQFLTKFREKNIRARPALAEIIQSNLEGFAKALAAHVDVLDTADVRKATFNSLIEAICEVTDASNLNNSMLRKKDESLARKEEKRVYLPENVDLDPLYEENKKIIEKERAKVAARAAAPAAAAPTVTLTPEQVKAQFTDALNILVDHPDLKDALTAKADEVSRKFPNLRVTEEKAKEMFEQLVLGATNIDDQNELIGYLNNTLGITGIEATQLGKIISKNNEQYAEKLQELERHDNVEAAIDELGKDRKDLIKLLIRHKGHVIAALNALDDVSPENTAKKQAENYANSLSNATNKEELEDSLQGMGITELTAGEINAILKRNQEQILKRLDKENLPRQATQRIGDQEIPLTSRKAQRGYKVAHPEFLLKKSFEAELGLLEKTKSLVNILAARAAASKFSSANAKTQEEVEKLSAAAFEKQKQLTQLRASCDVRLQANLHPDNKESAESATKIRNYQLALQEIDLLLDTLKDTQASIALTRTLTTVPQTETVYAGTESKQFNTLDEAQSFIQTTTGLAKSGGLSTSTTIHTKALLASEHKFDAIKRVAMVGDQQIITGSVQTVIKPGTKDESFHQEIYADPRLMSSRHGLRPNNLPADHIMEWAIDEVTSFVNLMKGNTKPILIHAGGMHKYQVEALMIVCAAQNLAYILPDGDPVKISSNDLKKRVEKAKRNEAYGLKLQSADELTHTTSTLRGRI